MTNEYLSWSGKSRIKRKKHVGKNLNAVVHLEEVYIDDNVPDSDVNKLMIENQSVQITLHNQISNLTENIKGIIEEKDWSFRDDNIYRFVLVLESGERTFDAVLRHQRIAGSEFSKHLSRGLAKAIAQMHEKKIIHGDLKPLNVIFVRDFTVIKLLDLDVLRPVGEHYGMKAPSTGYCSPEVARTLILKKSANILQNIKASVAHDLFAFGLILYELVTGQPMWKKDEDDNVTKTKKTL